MKKVFKISLSILLVIIIFFIIDFISIFSLGKPLFAIKMNCPNCYSGVFYDTYKCNDKMKIVLKNSEFFCQEEKTVKEIVDNTLSCDTALEKFYEDDEYEYLFRCIQSEFIFVNYYDETSENIKAALINKNIKITDLDRFNIKYTKHLKSVE